MYIICKNTITNYNYNMQYPESLFLLDLMSFILHIWYVLKMNINVRLYIFMIDSASKFHITDFDRLEFYSHYKIFEKYSKYYIL